jgi:hypothetical protein
MNKVLLDMPSGSLTNPAVAVMPQPSISCLKKVSLLTGYRGYGRNLGMVQPLSVTAARGGSGSGVFYNSFLRLPEGQLGWHVRAAERQARKEITARLTNALREFDGQDTRVVTEVFTRTDTPGTMNALRFCERYLMLGGELESLGKVGQVLLPLHTDLKRLTEENILDVTTVSIALYDAGAVITTAGAVELALELVGRGAEIAAVITERGITDGEALRGLVSEMDGVKSAVHGGVL